MTLLIETSHFTLESKELHIHLYGRAIDSVYQKFGDSIISGHKDFYQPLHHEDIEAIKKEFLILSQLQEFSDETWGLT